MTVLYSDARWRNFTGSCQLAGRSSDLHALGSAKSMQWWTRSAWRSQNASIANLGVLWRPVKRLGSETGIE
jgi:hypothetical protein